MIVFERPGPVNTDRLIELAVNSSVNCNYIVVASITGDSALKVAKLVRDKKVVSVTCPQGMYWEVNKMDSGPFSDVPELREIRDSWMEKGYQRVPMDTDKDKIKALCDYNVTIVKGTIPFFGPSFSMRLHINHTNSLDIVAKTLEMISTGTLVCLETVLMAVDASAIPEGEEVLALAGTERGLDTAWIIRSCCSANLFHPEKGARLVELLAKPGISCQPDIMIEYLR
ncbi:MAG: hypothetical protein JL50_20825 [Peptococcaceae bacterium BICA1-7]|nr:MAG: hypothetical protein JL50_20825 [Peptococcaceae bacterium BICA1-7]HBV98527.1 hypothetical protein [Desulfotomaculum sp.]